MNLNTQKWDRLAVPFLEVPFLEHAQLSKRTEEKHFHGPIFGTVWRYQKWDVSTKFNCFLARWFDGFNPFACFTEEYPTTSSFVNDLNNWVCSSSCHGFELQDCKFFVFNRPYSCWVGSCDQLFKLFNKRLVQVRWRLIGFQQQTKNDNCVYFIVNSLMKK